MTSAYNGIRDRIPTGLRHGLSKIKSFDAEVRPTAQQLLMVSVPGDFQTKIISSVSIHVLGIACKYYVVLNVNVAGK